MCKREALKKLSSMLLATTVALTSFTIPSFKNSLDASAVSVNTTYYYDGGRVQDWTAPCDGDYTITLKGGDGGKVIHGTITNSAGEVSTGWFYGAGGVTTINAYIKKGETLYMQIGTQGTTDGRGGFNGGGNTTASNAAGGGGCTSVTLESASKLKDIADESKILAVAGGGAGMRNDISNPSGGNNSHSSVSRSYRENTLTNNSTGGNGGGYRTATVGVSWTGDSGIGGAGYAPSGNNNLVKSTNKIFVYNSSVMAGYTFSRTAVSSSDGYVNIKLESEYKSKLTINYGNAAEDRTDEVFCEALNTYEIKKNSIEVDNIQGYSLRGYRIVGDTTNTTHPTTDSIYMTWDDKEITLVWDAQLNVKFTDKMISSTGRTAAEIIFSQDDDRKKTFTVYRSDNGIDFYPAELYNDGTGDAGTSGNYPIWSVSSPGIHGYTTGEEGVYEVVLEGARGGQDTPSNGGGIGGRVQAKVFLWGNRTYYFAVGGAGGDDTQGNGGFNGGGGAGHSGSSGAGGGCTALQMAYGTTAGVGEGNYIAIAGGGGGGNLGSSGGAGGSGGNNGMFAQGSNKGGDGGGGGAGYRGGTEGIDNGGKAQGGSSNINKSYLVGRASYGTSSRYGHGTASIQFKYPTPKFSGLNTYTKGFYIDDVDSPIIDSAVLNKDTNVVSIVAHDVGSTVTFKVISRDDDGNNIGEATATKNVFAGLKCIYYKVDDVPWCASVPTDNSITNFNDVGSGQFSCSFGLGDNSRAEYIHIVAVDNNDNRSAIQTLELKPKFRIYYSNNYLNYSDDLTMNVFNDIVTVENTRVYGDENTTTLVGAINPSISNYGESNTVKDNVTNNALGDKRYNLKGYKFVGWSKDKLITANTIQPDIPNIEVSSGGLSTPVTILNNTKPVVNYEKDSVVLPGKVIPYNYSNPNLVVYMILEPIGYSVNYHSNLASTPLSYKQWFFYDYSSDKLNTLDSKFVHKDSIMNR